MVCCWHPAQLRPADEWALLRAPIRNTRCCLSALCSPCHSPLLAAYDYEVRFGLFTQMQTCNDKIRKLLQLPFGPPTAWEVFNIMCKGTCR